MLHPRTADGRDGSSANVGTVVHQAAEDEQALQALRDSEASFRGMFEDAPVGIALVGIDFTWVGVNQRFCQIVGYPHEELLQKTIIDTIHPDDIEVYLRQAAALACGQIKPFRMEKRLVGKDGRTVSVNFNVALQRSGNGRPLHFICVVEDIDGRKRSEGAPHSALGDGQPVRDEHGRATDECGRGTSSDSLNLDVADRGDVAALRESEVGFRATFENAAVGMAQVGLDGCWLRINPRFCEIVGYRLDALRQKTFQDISHPDDVEDVLRRFASLVRGEINTFEIESRFVHKEGHVVWVCLMGALQCDDVGTPLYCITSIKNISARKDAEEELHRAKERAHVTLQSIGNALITTDAGGAIEYLNPTAERLTGWRTEEARGKPLKSVFNVMDPSATPEAVRSRASAAGLSEGARSEGLSGGLIGGGPSGHGLGDHGLSELPRYSVLVDRLGQEHAIEESTSPIRSGDGEVLGAVLVFHDVTENQQMARQLQHDAAHDPLTGLINRRAFEKRLERALASAGDHRAEHVLCYIDLDQFKLVNDSAGHAAGDMLLKQVRSVLSGKFRERDTFARLGGDEFALLLENCPLSDAIRIAESIVAAIREWRFLWECRSFRVGASVGVVAITDECASTAQLLAEADAACYAAKERGRGRVHVFRTKGEDEAPPQAQIQLAASLSDALERESFCLYCQPIADLAAARGTPPSRYEILIRLRDQNGALVLPEAFIPAAERYGLMSAIDRWVIATALRSYAEGIDPSRGIEIAINLSGESLSHEDFPSYVLDQLALWRIPPERICFEITETATIHNLDQAMEFVREVKKRGSRLAIDDFGSALSSFKYLRVLPADYLKIDGSFVRDILHNPQDEAVVSAINEVGHKLGMITIAEYAHSPAIIDRLRQLGVDCAQGDAIGLPSPWLDTFGLPSTLS